MIYVVLIALVSLLGLGIWRLGIRSRDVDEDIKYMNEGRGNGPGVFGIFRRDRS
jgi:hypothetical protein